MDSHARDLRKQAQADSYHSDLGIGVGRERAILAGMAGNLSFRPLFVLDAVLEKSAGVDHAHIGCPTFSPM